MSLISASALQGRALLRVEGLTMRFDGLTAVEELSFEARAGDITAVIGPNGAGKTTVFNCISGFCRPTAGRIVLARQSGCARLESMTRHCIARQGVVRTFQNIRLFAGLTVLENLLVAQHNALMAASGFARLGILGLVRYRSAEKAAVDKARHWLDALELTDRADDPAGALSYGAQRRLEIARAMCLDPILLCLDEPAAGLNPQESEALSGLVLRIRSRGTAILLIEHDMSVVMRISDHVVVLEQGRKIAEGRPEAVRANPRVIAAYLGTDDLSHTSDDHEARKSSVV
jgi:branched-chain amino acid transport system ATP-binding protein